jgi:anionic cell wall polymer biosynthesis LytR-Cps2A-Psr (LCP) family protein
VDYAGVKSLVEALGGVPVNVEKRMHYDDFSGGLHVNLEKGPQILDATQAEEYLRFRHDHTGDLGRMERQRWFMRGVVEKLHSPATIAKIPKLVEIAEKYSITDMNLYELSKFAAFASAIKPDEIQTATLPGRPSNHGSVSYWILDTDGAQSIIDKLIYRDKSYDPRGVYKVALLYNDSITTQRLDEIQANLEQYGFKVSCRDRSELPHTQIIAHSNIITTEEVGFIKRKISELKKAPFDISLENYRCGETDLTLVLSKK